MIWRLPWYGSGLDNLCTFLLMYHMSWSDMLLLSYDHLKAIVWFSKFLMSVVVMEMVFWKILSLASVVWLTSNFPCTMAMISWACVLSFILICWWEDVQKLIFDCKNSKLSQHQQQCMLPLRFAVSHEVLVGFQWLNMFSSLARKGTDVRVIVFNVLNVFEKLLTVFSLLCFPIIVINQHWSCRWY